MTNTNTASNKIPLIDLAYLSAYLPDGTVMEYRTRDYEHVYRFKKVCRQYGIDYAVRFRKIDSHEENASHIVSTRREKIKRFYNNLKRFLHSRLF